MTQVIRILLPLLRLWSHKQKCPGDLAANTSVRPSPGHVSALACAAYSTITVSLPVRPNTSGEYISSACAGGTTYVPGVVARAVYV